LHLKIGNRIVMHPPFNLRNFTPETFGAVKSVDLKFVSLG